MATPIGTLEIRLFEEENCLYWEKETLSVRPNQREEIEIYVHEIRKLLPSVFLDKIEFKFSSRNLKGKNILFVLFYINDKRYFKSKKKGERDIAKNLLILQDIFVILLWVKKKILTE